MIPQGVSIGSETSGWVFNITVRNSVLKGTNLAVRLKTSRGRGGGIKDVLYENLTGSTNGGIQINTLRAGLGNIDEVRRLGVEVEQTNQISYQNIGDAHAHSHR